MTILQMISSEFRKLNLKYLFQLIVAGFLFAIVTSLLQGNIAYFPDQALLISSIFVPMFLTSLTVQLIFVGFVACFVEEVEDWLENDGELTAKDKFILTIITVILVALTLMFYLTAYKYWVFLPIAKHFEMSFYLLAP